MVFCKRSKKPHPRDGPWAWLVCIAATVIFGLSFGYMLSFGVVLPVLSKHFNSSRGSTAWIGSLAIGFSYLFGPLAVKTIDLVNERTVGVCGALLASSIMAISSFLNNIIILYFLHGVFLGLCGSFILNSLLLIIRKYFKDKLAVAIGIASSGSSFGVLCIGPALHVLIDFLGWRGTFRVMSGVFVIIALLSLTFDPNIQEDEHTTAITCQQRDERSSTTRCQGFIDCSIWKSRRYVVGIVTIFLIYFGVLVPSIHLVSIS
ncbi:monocarboxylate transporter 3 [Exaiptasia diaphana]|uniref:Major facilitator superfamily (MFS) profile domain-containing protein n=1 Tax=Exaiptasia diaphana TaxID=2652724 RepID=A0A913YHN4_EXADI|nr:monocarboxylate transporter 3 [Exaiptasia diaphana]